MIEGFPWAMPEIICSPKLLVKKNDCNCKMPSMSQMVASTNCSVLRPSGLLHAGRDVFSDAELITACPDESRLTTVSLATKSPSRQCTLRHADAAVERDLAINYIL